MSRRAARCTNTAIILKLSENKKIFTSSYQQHPCKYLNSFQTHSLQPNLSQKWGIASFFLLTRTIALVQQRSLTAVNV